MKILASDYDGTLNYGGIDDKKRAAIAKWQHAGNLFGIVSGRGIDALLEIVKQDKLSCDFLIADNGAIIAGRDGTILKESRCIVKIAPTLTARLFELSCTACFIHNSSPTTVKADESDCRADEFILNTMPPVPYFNQISTFLSSVDEAAAVTKSIKEEFGEYVMPLQNHTCIDIVPVGTNKAQGLYSLISLLNATHGDVITVGDNINDTDMLAEFRSYAMNNAVDSVKAIANHMIDGITELIELELP